MYARLYPRAPFSAQFRRVASVSPALQSALAAASPRALPKFIMDTQQSRTASSSATGPAASSTLGTAGPASTLPVSAHHHAAPRGAGRPPHHGPKGAFLNPWVSYTEYGPWDFLTKVLPHLRRTKLYSLPRVAPDWPAVTRPAEAVQALWIGHAAFLVQMSGFNMLTDPVFSHRASPVQFMGPARYTPPACTPAQLPVPVHVVLISHNHYDHVDSGSVKALLAKEAADLRTAAAGGFSATASRPYTGTLWVAPLGVKALLVKLGVAADKVVELDWWQSYSPALQTGMDGTAVEGSGLIPRAAAGTVAPVAGRPAEYGGASSGSPLTAPFEISCVPAQHQSARTPFDRNESLWCGYVVRTPGPANAAPHAVYFSGDTGYRSIPKGVEPLSPEEAALPVCPAFSQIGSALGPMSLSLLPLGAYSPRWFMSSFHASPEDSVRMFKDTRSGRAVGMHWGTFPLTDEPIEEPPARLVAALAHEGVAQDAFVAVKPGALVGAAGGAVDPAASLAPAQLAAWQAAGLLPAAGGSGGAGDTKVTLDGAPAAAAVTAQ